LIQSGVSQPNSDIVDLCELQQWTACNKSYRSCQMKVNASPCPCFRQLLECGSATKCLSDQERAATIVACEALCAVGDCAPASTVALSSLLVAVSLAVSLLRL
jgi:hypothetical protein